MQIRALRIRISTDQGLHGVDIPFENGLVILRADNSMGKSTCIKSILIALGLEAMLTTNQSDLPLPPVMKAELQTESGIARVIESDIYIEIENREHATIVVHRTVRGGRDKNLITVTFGPALSKPQEDYRSEDFFVSRKGAALRERGFHRFLAEFFGWELPKVQTYEGTQCPLYLQYFFPYLIVEQTRGWSSLLPPLPTHFRVREPHKRAIDFLLNLDAYRTAARRLELDQTAQEIESKWKRAVDSIQATAKMIGGIAQRVPTKPVASWPPEIPPALVLPKDEEWIPAEKLLAFTQAEYAKLQEEEIPRVNEIVGDAEVELKQLQENLNGKAAILARLLESLEMEKGEVDSTQERLEKINDDLQRNKDAKTLLSFGSTFAPNLVEQICPSCHQQIADSLTPLAKEQSIMSIDENIAFLDEQYRTFRAVLTNVEAIVEVREQQVSRIRDELSEMRRQIRVLKSTLISDGRLPSKAAIRKQIELGERIETLEKTISDFYEGVENLEPLVENWQTVQGEKSNLPKKDVSESDCKKIVKLGELLRSQLVSYDFQSLEVEKISVSVDTYGPSHEGFDLPSNISASDFIRVIWSYLASILEISREFDTHHPGLLVFDEPRQQSAKDLSFENLLKRVSIAGKYNQQVIFATSEKLSTLHEMLESVPHTLHQFDGHIIQPLK